MSDNAPLSRKQLQSLAAAHEKTAEVLLAKLKKAETQTEKDVLFKQMHLHNGKALAYRLQEISVTLTLGKAEAKKLISLMNEAATRLKKLEKADDLVSYSGRILQAAAMIAGAAAGGSPAIVATIANLLIEGFDEAV